MRDEDINWICVDCGLKYGEELQGVVSWYIGICDICGEEGVAVTQPRNFGYLSELPDNKRRKQEEDTDWLQKLQEGKAVPYFKPIDKLHEGGFKRFEIGYCVIGDGGKLRYKKKLGDISDHIWNGGYLGEKFAFNMDQTRDNYIRIWSNEKTLYWQFNDVLSTATLTVLGEDDKKYFKDYL